MNKLLNNNFVMCAITSVISAGLVSIAVAFGAVRCEDKSQVELMIRQILPTIIDDKPRDVVK